LTKENNNDELDQTIIQTLKQQQPQTVNQLITLTRQKTGQPEQQILKHITKMQQQQKITLKPPQTPPPQTLTAYLQTSQAHWYWTTIALTAATILAVFTIPENTPNPAIYARYILAAIFILFLPGYTLTRALFPKHAKTDTASKQDLDIIERIALSLGVSIAITPMTGLLLNYTPWGITLTPITLSLTALTLAFATAATIREQQTIKPTQPT
jgi:hypothetical protein